MPNPLTSAPSKLKIVKDSDAKPFKVLPMPQSLPKEMRKEWTNLVKHLHGLGMWHNQKASVVETYLLNLNALRFAQLALDDTDNDIQEGDISTTMARHSAQIARLATVLGLDAKTAPPASPDDDIGKVWG